MLARADHEGLSHLEFVRMLLGEQANQRRERSIARRIREAGFREGKTLADFDWQFNAATIDRVRIETLVAAEFIARQENLVLVGQSGVGKTRIIEAIGMNACALGYRVWYRTSADMLAELTAALADQTLPRLLREYARIDLLIIDEFGFDQIERNESRQAASLQYKLIDMRSLKRSTALVTNIDFECLTDAELKVDRGPARRPANRRKSTELQHRNPTLTALAGRGSRMTKPQPPASALDGSTGDDAKRASEAPR